MDPIPTFENAWAAVYWTYLTKPFNTDVIDGFQKSLTFELMESWRHTIASMQPRTQAFLRHAQLTNTWTFRDVTKEYKEMETFFRDPQSKMLSGRWEPWVNVTATTWISCPAGCTRHFDDPAFRRISMKHYIAYIDRQFKSFRASANVLRGATPYWDTLRKKFGFTFQPGLLTSTDAGPQFFACKKKYHGLEGCMFIHIPNNPCITLPVNAPSAMAPIIPTQHFKFSGRQRETNITFPVLEQSGNATGLSTFQLCQQLGSMPPQTEEVENAAAMVMHERDDIYNHYASVVGEDEADLYKAMGEHVCKTRRTCVERSQRSGTFIDKADALHELKAMLDTNHTESLSDPPVQNTSLNISSSSQQQIARRHQFQKHDNRLKQCLTIVRRPIHPESNRRQTTHPPLVIPLWTRLRGNDTGAAGTTLLLSALGNVRSLHRNFNEFNWERTQTSNQQAVLTAIQCILHRELQGKQIRHSRMIYIKVSVIDNGVHSQHQVTTDSITHAHNNTSSANTDNSIDHHHSNDIASTASSRLQNIVVISDRSRRTPLTSSQHCICPLKITRLPDIIKSWLIHHTNRIESISDPWSEVTYSTSQPETSSIDALIYTTPTTSRNIRAPPLFIRNNCFTLVFAAQLRSTTEDATGVSLDISTRWSSDECWARIVNGHEIPIQNISTWDNGIQLTGTFNFLVYESMINTRVDHELRGFNLFGGQNKAVCSDHRTSGYLVHMPFTKGQSLQCCYGNVHCKNKSSWRCTYRMAHIKCPTALCEKHMTEVRKHVDVSYIHPSSTYVDSSESNSDQDDICPARSQALHDVSDEDMRDASADEDVEKSDEFATSIMTLGDAAEQGMKHMVIYMYKYVHQ